MSGQTLDDGDDDDFGFELNWPAPALDAGTAAPLEEQQELYEDDRLPMPPVPMEEEAEDDWLAAEETVEGPEPVPSAPVARPGPAGEGPLLPILAAQLWTLQDMIVSVTARLDALEGAAVDALDALGSLSQTSADGLAAGESQTAALGDAIAGLQIELRERATEPAPAKQALGALVAGVNALGVDVDGLRDEIAALRRRVPVRSKSTNESPAAAEHVAALVVERLATVFEVVPSGADIPSPAPPAPKQRQRRSPIVTRPKA